MNARRYQPEGSIRSFGDQVEELCAEKKLLKQEVAQRANISPSQLAHYLKFGTSLTMIERISKAVGIEPEYFDVYVAEDSPRSIGEHAELIEFLRRFRKASKAKRREMLEQLP